MIDPSLTEVWRRRVVAAVIDLVLVLGVFGTLAVLQAEEFTRDSAGFFSPEDFDRLATLSETANRYIELGDTRYVLAGGELLMTVVVSLLAIAAVYVLIPGSTGTSPGKAVTRLKVVTLEGDPIELWPAFVRSVVGVVDLLPLVVPWVVGAKLARHHPRHQRLGDRVAGTAVVDARRPLLLSAMRPAPDPVEAETPTADRPEVDHPPVAAARGAEGPGPEVEADRSAAPARVPGRLAPPPQHRTASAEATAPAGRTTPADAAGSSPGRSWDLPRVEPAPVWDPAVATGRVGAPAPAGAQFGALDTLITATEGEPEPGPTAAGPPRHRDRRAPAEAPRSGRRHDDRPGDDAETAGSTVAGDDAETAGSTIAGEGAETAGSTTAGDDASGDPAGPPAGQERRSTPEVEPVTEQGDGDAATDVINVEAPLTDDVEAPLADDLDGGGDLDRQPADHPAPAVPPPATASPDQRADGPRVVGDPVAPPGLDGLLGPAGDDQPIWDDDWQAWLFYDREAARWNRHDPDTGRWEPIG